MANRLKYAQVAINRAKDPVHFSALFSLVGRMGHLGSSGTRSYAWHVQLGALFVSLSPFLISVSLLFLLPTVDSFYVTPPSISLYYAVHWVTFAPVRIGR